VSGIIADPDEKPGPGRLVRHAAKTFPAFCQYYGLRQGRCCILATCFSCLDVHQRQESPVIRLFQRRYGFNANEAEKKTQRPSRLAKLHSFGVTFVDDFQHFPQKGGFSGPPTSGHQGSIAWIRPGRPPTASRCNSSTGRRIIVNRRRWRDSCQAIQGSRYLHARPADLSGHYWSWFKIRIACLQFPR